MKKILINIYAVLCIFIFLMYVNVNAESNYKLNLDINKQDIKSQDEVSITFKIINDININRKINVYKATIEYDKRIFEELSDSSFYCKNGWSNLKYNNKNNQFIIVNKDGNSESEEIFQLNLKVKKNVTIDETSIKIKDIIISYGDYDIVIESKNIDFKIIDNKNDEQQEENKEGIEKIEDNNNQQEETKEETEKIEDNNNQQEETKEETEKIEVDNN